MRSSTQQKKSRPILFIFGPTASGKTALVERLFTKGYQIVNADSVQVYRMLDIGSAKPSADLMAKIPHHLVDILEPWQQFTAGSFVHLADEAVEKTYTSGDIPILTGGTAFYFKNFLYGLSQAPQSDPEVRRHVAQELDRYGAAALHERLEKVDPVSAGRISVNDAYRITRALEVYEQSGRPLSAFDLPTEPRGGMRPLILNLVRDRDELYERIALRVDIMFREGLVDEIRRLRKAGARADWPGLGGIGYAEFFHAFDNGCSNMGAIRDEIILNSRHYAKRQMTFFRSFADAYEVNPEDTETVERLVADYLSTF